jgi:hypothetical protein
MIWYCLNIVYVTESFDLKVSELFYLFDIQQETINTTNSSITMNMNQSMKCNKLNFIYTLFFELKEHACRRLYGDQNITKASNGKIMKIFKKRWEPHLLDATPSVQKYKMF